MSVLSSNCKEEIQNVEKRLTYSESFDPNNTFYIIDTKKEYIDITNLVKNEEIKNSSTYTYEWSNHTKKININLKKYLPKTESNGYINLTKYDFIYLNIYSKKKLDVKIILLIQCQERIPDEKSDMKNTYKQYSIPIDFIGWKEIKIPFNILNDGYGADLSKVTGLVISSFGWGAIPNSETQIYFDKFLFTNIIYTFNMEESEIPTQTYSNILESLKYLLLSHGNLKNEKNKIIVNRLNTKLKEANYFYKIMNKNGLPFNLPMENTGDLTNIYDKIKRIAIGYAIYGSDNYGNKIYLNDIINCLNYMHKNYYTKRKNNIFKGFNNWWDWEIGVPKNLVEILLYLKADLTQKQIDTYLNPLNEYIPLPTKEMSNRADIAYSCIIAGVLQKDYKRIAFSVEMLRELFNNVKKGDGFYDDGSFIQHMIFAYTGGYGSHLITALTKITYILKDTVFRLDDEMRENQFIWIYNSFIPFLYNGAYFDLVRGRGIVRNTDGLSSGVSSISSLVFMTEYIDNNKNLNFIKNYLKNIYEMNPSFYNNSLEIGSLSIIEEIISKKNIKFLDDFRNNFAKIYSKMDKAIAIINGVGLGISLSSTRIGKYESINGDNLKGWYQGDGMTYIYLSPNDYANSYWPYINYYRLPGTTVTKAERKEVIANRNNALAKCDFVGGAYTDIYMVVAMQFSSENLLINFNSSLIGNKGYFIFEDIFVFIGNNISCKDKYEVETIIENRKLNGKLYFGDKEIETKCGNGDVTSNYIYIENYGGIYIPDYKNVKYNISNKGFLEIYIEHGKNFENGKYIYYILPKVDKNNLKTYVNNIEIKFKDNKIIAVKNKSSNIVEYIFFEKGKIDKIQVDKPCTIIMKNNNEIYVSDPTQKLNEINITFNFLLKYNVKVSNGYTTKIKINY